MKTKVIVASAVGLLGIATIVLGATTFAGNVGTGHMGYGSGAKMMKDHEGKMEQFASTGDAEAFRIAVDAAFAAKDYTAFIAAHTKYGITKYPSEEEFTAKATEKANKELIKTALTNGDYTTRKTLNEGNPILEKITTESQFELLQQLENYKEKVRTIEAQLGLEMPKQGPGGRGMGEGRGMGMGPKTSQ